VSDVAVIMSLTPMPSAAWQQGPPASPRQHIRCDVRATRWTGN